ncbi:MAG: hypothetical protein ACLFNZ_03110 [Spirochaetaceae bacterium]
MQLPQGHILTVLLVVAALFACWGELYAGGVQEGESRLEKAEELIDERRYNDAMELLTTVMREDPERFHEAEQLMERVRDARERYNDTYEELIDILSVEAEEELVEEEAYEVIRRLEELDADPNEASVEAFAQARRSIIFAVNDREFQSIMDEAADLLAEEKYREAIDTYLSGFSIHRELFIEDEYGEVVSNQVESQKEQLEEYAGDIQEQLPGLQGQMEELAASADSEPAERVMERYAALEGELERLFELWNDAVSTALELDNLRETIQRDDESDVPHLSTVRILAKGREASEQPDGIAGAAERPAASGVLDITEVLKPVMMEGFDDTLTLYREGETVEDEQQYEQIYEGFEDADGYASVYQGLLEQWRSHLEFLSEYGMARKTGPAGEKVQSEELLSRALRTASEEYRSLMEGTRAARRQEESGLEAEEPAVIEESREGVRGQRSEFEETLSRISQMRNEYEEHKSEGIETTEAESILAGLSDSYSNRIENIRNSQGRLAARIYQLQIDPREEYMEDVEEKLTQGRSYVEGVEDEVVEGSEAVTVKYPGRALSLLEELASEIEEIQPEVEGIVEELEEEPEELRGLEPVSRQKRRAEDILQRIDEILDERGTIVEDARELNREADMALSEGRLRYEEAQTQLDRDNFERARDKLEQASDAFSESLSYREDSGVRERLDNDVPELADEIVYQQNQQIVREVRELINRGKNLFFQEEFIEAEQVLLRAEARWEVTHTEPEPEISLWLDRVQRALETTTGVTIEQSDPLYPDMMQVLNLAKRDYERGKSLYEGGEEEEAMEVFREAEKKIEMIKEPFPNNQEAGVLYLRILQYTEPDDFNTIIQERLSAAQEKIETVPEEAYRELKEIEEIRPDLDGLEQAIYDAEIETGIRTPPPDPEKLARAEELYEDAQQIVEDDERAQFPVAVSYLNEAIELDPDFQEAINLKDRIQSGQGGGVRVVLSSVDQQKMRRAENLFIESRYYEASALVEQLLQDEENAKNPKLLELKRRIESKL